MAIFIYWRFFIDDEGIRAVEILGECGTQGQK
jgi:hypothetical protein